MKDNFTEFYVNKFFCLKTPDTAEVEFIPPIIRRRMSKVDKYTLAVLNKIYSSETENIVFSSRFGEVERLIKLISQYCENKEVSPNTFTGSVHNYPAGFYLLNIQKPIPYTALSAGENTVSSGLLSAIVSDYKNIIFCYSDYCEDEIISFGLNISKVPVSSGKKYKLIIQQNKKQDVSEDYINFFGQNDKTLITPLFSAERVDE